jgi:hypothetical protein
VLKQFAMPRRYAHHKGQSLDISTPRPNELLWQVGQWPSSARFDMDAAFRAAVLRAVANGEERCVTQVSTAFGTKAPRVVGPEDFAGHKDGR